MNNFVFSFTVGHLTILWHYYNNYNQKEPARGYLVYLIRVPDTSYMLLYHSSYKIEGSICFIINSLNIKWPVHAFIQDNS